MEPSARRLSGLVIHRTSQGSEFSLTSFLGVSENTSRRQLAEQASRPALDSSVNTGKLLLESFVVPLHHALIYVMLHVILGWVSSPPLLPPQYVEGARCPGPLRSRIRKNSPTAIDFHSRALISTVIGRARSKGVTGMASV